MYVFIVNYNNPAPCDWPRLVCTIACLRRIENLVVLYQSINSQQNPAFVKYDPQIVSQNIPRGLNSFAILPKYYPVVKNYPTYFTQVSD